MPWASVTPSSSCSMTTFAPAAGWPSRRALTSSSTRSPQALTSSAAASRERKRRLGATMAVPSVFLTDFSTASLHRGGLDIDFARIDDLVLVGGRALDRAPLGLLDPAQLEVDLGAERADLDRLGLRLVADAADFDLVD